MRDVDLLLDIFTLCFSYIEYYRFSNIEYQQSISTI